MAKPGNVAVVTEVGYCPFCGRTRNLRREERHLGGLVRTNVECETCHRTLSSTMSPAAPEPVTGPEPPAPEAPSPEPETETETAPKPVRKRATTAARKSTPSTKKAPAKKKA